MNINDIFNKCDESRIKVLSGDLAEDIWELQGTTLVRSSSTSSADSVDLASSVSKVEFKHSLSGDSVEPLVGAGIGALLGSRLGQFIGLGPSIGAVGGAVAGHFLTKNPQQVSVSVELKDGRTFLAVMQPAAYDRLKALETIGTRAAAQ